MPFRIVDHGSAKAWYGDVKTIRLVSNDPSALKGLGELLRRCRYAVIAPREGLTALSEIAFSIILTSLFQSYSCRFMI